MLNPVPEGPAIVVCNTCRQVASGRNGDAGSDGEAMAAALKGVAASDARYAPIDIQTMPCLFACGEACTVHLRAPGKIGYVLGRFTPDTESARALLDYALHHAASENGQVPYALWPEGVKGHFLVRVPPPGFVAQ